MAKSSVSKKKPAARKKKKPAGKKPEAMTAKEILALWMDASKKGLGRQKRFQKAVVTEFGPRLLASISANLGKRQFRREDKTNTTTLATALGRLCRDLTKSDRIDRETFQKAFEVIKSSELCPQGGGAGEWCNI